MAILWSDWPRSWIIARYEIFLEAARHPPLLKIQRKSGGQIQEIWNEVFLDSFAGEPKEPPQDPVLLRQDQG